MEAAEAASIKRLYRLLNGQAERLISIPRLKPLQALHLGPINLVVFQESSYHLCDWEI